MSDEPTPTPPPTPAPTPPAPAPQPAPPAPAPPAAVQPVPPAPPDVIHAYAEQARRNRDAELTAAFGCPLDQVAQRLQAAGDVNAAQAQVAAERHLLAVERVLLGMGVPGATSTVAARLVEVAVGADTAAITAAAEALKGQVPALFTAATPAPAPAPSGDPAGPGAAPPPAPAPTDVWATARDRAAQRFPDLVPPASKN